ncbi:IS110 family transposase [Curtanaerobium respiraculi]|uniref:IS110 family transposase n=1 Tax=Curtanaerobium respiraculi TaxID=2949669 RepID=UPI0024B3B75D|nr:IS110 family transposase [Curtanaerobium respiraculi]
MNYIGIDIAKNGHVAAAVSDRGELIGGPFPFANDAEGFDKLAKFLDGAGCDAAGDIVVMESTGHYWLALWPFLDSEGWALALVNPIQTDAFRRAEAVRKAKTDDIDAVLIAQFARFKALGPSAVSPEAADGLRQLTRYRAHLVDERTSLKNRATALADRLFPELAKVLPGGMQSAAFRTVARDYGTPEEVASTDAGRSRRRCARRAWGASAGPRRGR